MSYINYNSILTADELKALGALMEQVKSSSTHVRILRHGTDTCDETVDLSMVLMSDITYPERFALIKRFFDHHKGHDSPIDMLWGLLTSGPIPDDLRYRANLVNVFEPFCTRLYEIVTGEQRPGIVLNDLYTLTVMGNSSFFMPKTSVVGRFFLRIKQMRNNLGHGKPLPKDAGIMIVLGLLLLSRLYYKQLTKRYISDNEMIEIGNDEIASVADLPEETEARMENMAARHSTAAAEELARKFGMIDEAATASRLDTLLPSLLGKLSYQAGLTVIEGNAGSGVSTELLRAIVRREPCPFIIRIDEVSLTKGSYSLDWLVGILAGLDRMTMLPVELEISKRWIKTASAEGKLCLVIDRAVPQQIFRLKKLFADVPDLMVLLGIDRADSAALKAADSYKPRIITPQPLTRADQEYLVTLVGRHLVAGADLSGVLLGRIDALGDGVDLSHPHTLVAALRELSQTLTATDPDYMAVTDRLSKLRARGNDFAKLAEAKSAIAGLASAVHEMIYGGAGPEEACRLIGESVWMRKAVSRRRLFELCHLMADDDKVALLATLAAKVILDGDRGKGGKSEGLRYNPRLLKLASSTRTLPVTEPRARNGSVIYRPEPRYIAERYVVNALRGCAETDSADSLLAATLSVGSDEVISLLMHSPLLGTAATAVLFSPTAAPVNPGALGAAIVDTIQRRSMTGRGKCEALYHTYRNLLEVMNDAQRLDLCSRLTQGRHPRTLTFLPTASAVNMAIMSMDVPAGHERYDADARMTTMTNEFIDGFASRCSGEISMPLLMKVARHAARQGNMRLLRKCLLQLTATGAYRSPDFRALADELLGNPNKEIARTMTDHIDMMPLEELDRDIATRVYNPTLTDLTVSWLNNSTKARTRLRELGAPTVAMLSTALPMDYCVEGSYLYPYRLYGYGDNCAELAVENFSDQVLRVATGRFVDIGAGGAIGRVTGSRRILPADPDARYAHLTVELPADCELPEAPGQIHLCLPGGAYDSDVSYIARYQRTGSPIVILRITDPETIDALREGPLNNAEARIGGRRLRLREIEIVRLTQPLTLLTVSACYKLRPAGLPDQGRYSLHYSPDKTDRKYVRTIALPMTPTVSRARNGYVRNAFSGGCEGDDLMIVLPAREILLKGTVLRVGADGPALKIMVQYFLNNRPTIPAAVARRIDAAIVARGATPDEMSGALALLVRPLEGTVADMPDSLTTPGMPIADKLKRQWVTGIFSPVSPLWNKSSGTGAYECAWVPLQAVRDTDGTFAARIPASPAWKRAAYMRLFGVPFTFKATFDGTDWSLDPMIKSLLRSRADSERSSEPFYVMMLDADRKPLRPRWDNASELINRLGRWGHIAPETATMIADIAADDHNIIAQLKWCIAAEAEAVGHEKWLRRKLFLRCLTPELCRLLPLRFTRVAGAPTIISWRDSEGNPLPIADEIVTQLKTLLRDGYR